MTLDELKKAVKDGSIDTVLLGFADMQGRFQGKRLVADHFLEEVVSHGAEACNYLLAVDVDMNTVDGYAMSSWETGYGDFEMKPDFDTLRLVPWHEGTAMCMADLQWHGDKPVAASPRQILRAAARPARRARLDGLRGHRARVHRLPRHLRAGVPQALPGPRARQPLQRRLLDARHRAAGAADRAHPARDGARRPAGGELQGRVQLRPARDQLHATRPRCTPPTRTRSTRTAPRRSPPRRAWRSRSWPSTTSARATRATSTSPCAGRTARRCSPSSPSCSSASSPASSPACRS